VVASAGAGAGAGAAAAAVLRAGAAPPDTLAGTLRGGGATGVVAMTWISGSFAALELEASCAATLVNPIASTPPSAQRDPHNTKRGADAVDSTTQTIPRSMCNRSCRPCRMVSWN